MISPTPNKTNACVVHQRLRSARDRLPTTSVSGPLKTMSAIPNAIRKIHQSMFILQYIGAKKKASNGTWTRTGRAEFCHATPITSCPRMSWQYARYYRFKRKMQVKNILFTARVKTPLLYMIWHYLLFCSWASATQTVPYIYQFF